jgi:hypothetical protein
MVSVVVSLLRGAPWQSISLERLGAQYWVAEGIVGPASQQIFMKDPAGARLWSPEYQPPRRRREEVLDLDLALLHTWIDLRHP